MAKAKAKVAKKIKPVSRLKNVKMSASKKKIASRKLLTPRKTNPVLLSDKCEIDHQSIKPAIALPAKCAIQKPRVLAPPDNLPVEKLENKSSGCYLKHINSSISKKTARSYLSPRKSFWLGMFFGLAIMGFLVFTFWSLFSAEFVIAAVFR